jgi:hypothetical protein
MKGDLDFVSVIDGRVDINNLRNKQYGIYRGGSQNTYKQFISNTFDDSQISWVATPPNQNTYVARRMMIRMQFQLNFTGTSAGAGIPLIQASGLPHAPGVNPGIFQYDAPRAYPLSESFKTLAVQMNNDNISTNLATYARIMQRFNRDKDEEDKDYSLTPSMPDKSQSYDDLLGFPLNPLASYGDNAAQCPRGGFSGCLITRNDSTGLPGDQATILLDVTEPCWLSPWAFGRNQEDVSFIQVQNINVQCTLGGRGNGALTGLISSLWSHAPAGSVLSAASANVLAGSLLFNYISPDLTQQLPQEVNYSYFEPTLYPTGSNVAIPPGGSTTLVMNNVQLNSVPNRMYVWASIRDQDVNISTTNTYFRIDNVNITYNNQDGILSNMVIQDHYMMYLRNGGNMSFEQYSLYVGSIMCIGFGTDIPLDALSAPGMRNSQNLSLTIRVTNVSSAPIVPTLNVLVIQEGVMMIRDQSVMRSVGVLDAVDILNARSQVPISYKGAKTFHGAGFWDDIGGFFKKAFRPAVNVARSLAPAPFQPLVQAVSDVGSSYGLGLGQRRLR